MSNDKTNASIYVEIGALENWSSRMRKINEEALTILQSLDATIKEIDNYWVGTSATSFKNASDRLIRNAKRCHDNMKDLPRKIDQVAESVDMYSKGL